MLCFGCRGLEGILDHDLVAVAQRAIKLVLGLDPARIQPLALHRFADSLERRQASLRSFIDEDEMRAEARRDGPLPSAQIHGGELFGEAFAERARDVALRHLAERLAEQEGIADRRPRRPCHSY